MTSTKLSYLNSDLMLRQYLNNALVSVTSNKLNQISWATYHQSTRLRARPEDRLVPEPRLSAVFAAPGSPRLRRFRRNVAHLSPASGGSCGAVVVNLARISGLCGGSSDREGGR